MFYKKSVMIWKQSFVICKNNLKNNKKIIKGNTNN